MANTGLLELNGKDLTVVIDEETAEKAPLASPAFTGTATLNGNNIATTNQIPNTSTFATKTELGTRIRLTGARGNLAGYEATSVVTSLVVSENTPDSTYYNATAAITVHNGSANQSWTKVVMFGQQPSSVNLGSSWSWVGGSAPSLAANGVLVLTWQHSRGIANFLSPSS